MTTSDALDLLDGTPDLVGHIPEPIADYLEWVLVAGQGSPAAVELGRVLADIHA